MHQLLNIRILYAYSFFHSLIPAYVIERLFWEERGMTVLMVIYTEIFYAVTIVLLEVPSGILADKWGRKKLILISAAVGAFEFLILLFSSEFWHFAASVFLAGVSMSAFSGAANALMYDSLKTVNLEDRFEKHLGYLDAVGFFAAILAALSGSLLANKFGFELNYWLSFAASAFCVLIAISLSEPASTRSGEKKQNLPIKEYLTGPIHFLKSSPEVCAILLSGMATGAAINYIYEFWQLYLDRLSIPVLYFGVFSAGIMVLSLPGSLLAHWLIRKYTPAKLLTAVLIIFTGGFLYLASVKGPTGLAALYLVCLASGIVNPIVTGFLHHRIDSEMRATFDSFQSLGLNASRMLTGLGFGFFAGKYDIFGGYGFVAFVCACSLLIFHRYSKPI
ncbi:MFS transporter [Bacillus sp. FJAT-27225]|uniref:MFS transporter n=1 Tax=Bacillus sp. FJAT-27225 TaxID=1743144 RepID=UPI00080C30DA|nr:MFS transporter [Bacillus sp. FJAT-27225]OCA83293.1 MFS transporter [Bacillus sp. FJAT-27225]